MLNHIALMGRLVREPEARRTTTNKAVTSFTLAVDRDTAEKQTDFIDCVAWGSTAERASRMLKKGTLIGVHGRLQLREWTDKSNNKRVSPEVVIDNFYFGEGKKKELTTSDFEELGDDEELPF